jgi:hypothetical protein
MTTRATGQQRRFLDTRAAAESFFDNEVKARTLEKWRKSALSRASAAPGCSKTRRAPDRSIARAATLGRGLGPSRSSSCASRQSPVLTPRSDFGAHQE